MISVQHIKLFIQKYKNTTGKSLPGWHEGHSLRRPALARHQWNSHSIIYQTKNLKDYEISSTKQPHCLSSDPGIKLSKMTQHLRAETKNRNIRQTNPASNRQCFDGSRGLLKDVFTSCLLASSGVWRVHNLMVQCKSYFTVKEHREEQKKNKRLSIQSTAGTYRL